MYSMLSVLKVTFAAIVAQYIQYFFFRQNLTAILNFF